MKKTIFALVAMMATALTSLAQNETAMQTTNDPTIKFERICENLNLTAEQREPVKTAMMQLSASLQSLDKAQSDEEMGTTWDKIHTRHLQTMQRILTKKQFERYVQLFELT